MIGLMRGLSEEYIGSDLTFNALFGGWGQSKGTAWWDEVRLQEYELVPEEGQNAEVAGDAMRGKTIFHEHPIANCIRCHVVGGEGGPVGPALDGIASRKDRAYIMESLIDPGAKIAEVYIGQVSPMPPMGVPCMG